MNNHVWTEIDIPDLTGKTAIVTGANSGLGYHVALEMARKGAHVVMACRSKNRAREAMDLMLKEIPNASLEIMLLDLASRESIRAFSEAIKEKYSSLNILINNAGIMGIPRTLTTDGFEMQFGTNHLGHFALTGLLFDMIRGTPGSRVVTVSSLMHQFGVMNFNDLMGEKSYKRWTAYSQSKLANLLFAYELQRKFENINADSISLGAHPGYAATNLQFAYAKMKSSVLDRWFNNLANKVLAQSSAQGALPELFAATAPQAEGGTFIGPDRGSRGFPKVVRSNTRSYDIESARKLWQVSETLTGIHY